MAAVGVLTAGATTGTKGRSGITLIFQEKKNQQQLSNVSQKDVKSIPLYGKIENK
ncbi:MAG: hypothetical protein ACLTB5_01885 [Acutalibacteraceae bacterium]